MQKFIGRMKFLPLAVTQTTKTEFYGMKISNLDLTAFVISNMFSSFHSEQQ